MAQKSARDVVEKWSRNLGASGASMTAGINAVTEAPGQAAANSIDLYVQKVNEAAQSGKTARNMAAVSLESWKTSALNKGVARATASARDPQALQKTTAFMEEFLPFAEGVSQEIKRMPKGTLADSIARSTAAIEKMATFSFTRRS